MSAPNQSCRVAFFPAFSAEDAAEFTDQAHRAKFYLNPVHELVGEIAMARADGMNIGAAPEYLDPTVMSLAPLFAGKFRFCSVDECLEACKQADYVLHWRIDVPLPTDLNGKRVRQVDRHRYLEECQEWLALSSDIGGSYSYKVEQSKARYQAVVAKHRAARCYIFGTGPNLSLAAHHDYSDGVSVVCNSMVKNTALLDRMRPPLILAADPIFHAGDDELRGGGGADRIEGGDGADLLFGEDGNDRLIGGNGDDRLHGGAGNDRLEGGAGSDWALYDAGAAVTVNLASGVATGQGSDTLLSIENVRGSSFNDVLIGNNSANILAGNGGSDVLTGGGGADVFVLSAMNSGNVTITDFQDGVDRIDLRELGFDQNGQSPTWAGFLSNVPGQSDAVLEFYGVNGEFFTVTLTGTPYWAIDPSDYIVL